jgi:hypothetical protein
MATNLLVIEIGHHDELSVELHEDATCVTRKAPMQKWVPKPEVLEYPEQFLSRFSSNSSDLN